MSRMERLRYFAALPGNYAMQVVSNLHGIVTVADMLWLRPVKAGAIEADHPFCTGVQPGSERPIWLDNLVYATPRREHWGSLPRKLWPETDEQILQRVGAFMAKMVSNAARSESHPVGKPSRMPPAVNYLHGPVHYNGGWFLFNDFAEAIEHMSDRTFRTELKRFVAREQREPLFVFRDRDYDRDAFAAFVCSMRSVLPWFSNSNGPKRRVLWGNPAPYAVVNIITGNWIRDTRGLLDPKTQHQVPRAPLAPGSYFREQYRGWRREALWPERLLARLTARRIRARGAKGNLFFVDARRLREGTGSRDLTTRTQTAIRVASDAPGQAA